jgi:kynurenine formamidase
LFTGVLIDISHKVTYNDFEIKADDIKAWENKYGPIPNGSVVLIRFGWSSRHYANHTAYYGLVNSNSSEMHFPGKTIKILPQ